MRENYCSKCGGLLQPYAKYCSLCGAETEPPVPYLISVQRVFILSALSGGLYLFWWFYITWKHYRDHSGEKAYPIWHALTLFVPFYSLFRVHAHMRTYRELMIDRRLISSISPLVAVVVMFISGWLGNAGLREILFEDLSRTLAIWILAADVGTTVITVWLLTSVQININRYWNSFFPRASSCRVGVGEVIITIVGLLFMASSVADVFSETWRTP